ncbi:MAG: hypothetical protein Q9191_007546 [Dirinaria sp. TL-2023a]
MSADSNILAPDKPVRPGLNESWWTRHFFVVAPGASEESEASQEESEASPGEREASPEAWEVSQEASTTVAPVISPLQAALRGFSRFNFSLNIYGSIYDSKYQPRKARKSRHEEVILFLISNGSKPNDLGGQDKYPIQMAVEFCPIHIVERFISTGININATIDGRSALFAAAGRELSSAFIVRRLLAAGATIPEKVEEQEELLEQALRYFKGNTSGTGFDIDGHFLEAPSLEYVFNKGSGAVLVDLLHRMP